MAVGLYDQFLAGNNLPADPSLHVPYQAAQTTANYLAWFISSCSAVISVGSMALVARFTGAGKRARRFMPPTSRSFLRLSSAWFDDRRLAVRRRRGPFDADGRARRRR